MPVWPTIERFIAEHGSAVLVTLADAQGSSPREVGARMVVRPDGAFSGTIGGGALEWIALAEAQAMLARTEQFRRLDKALGPDLGQCCGGRVRVTLERFDADDRADVAVLASAERGGRFVTVASVDDSGRPVRHVAAPGEINTSADTAYKKLRDGRIVERFGEDLTQLYLFGAGHVGRALVLALAPLPFAVTWIDPRPGAFPAHIPGNVSCVGEGEPVQVLARAPDDALVAVMTHSHALDLDLVAAALKSRRFGYVGLIGSATKRARFVSTMSKLGLAKADIDRLVCPIGLQEIEDKAPAAIAASTVAQLLIVRERGVLALAGHEHSAGPSASKRHG
jgi:xanthine dehydrogenase accessory factor